MTDGLTLNGRTAIVTGAANGLGRAEAIALGSAAQPTCAAARAGIATPAPGGR